MPGSSNDFRYLAPYAEDARVRFLRLDSPGHGATPLGDTAPTVEATALFAKEAATQLLGPSRKYVAVGHSQGGPVAIKLAHLDDNCVGVALLCPVTHRPHRGIRPWWIQQFFTRLSESSALGRSISVAVMGPPYKALGFFKVSPDELILAVRRVGYLDFPQLKEDASTLPKPNALFFSHDDQLIEPAVFAEFSDLLPAGDRFPFETGGHNIQKFQAEKCAQGILALVSRLQCAEKVATDDAAFEDRRPRRDFEKLA
ncbi:Alpha/Beta hydrolase protein [Pelagophyceae sp. CCMP2097]|nr:Alpha/Beta hydrolase protein [Pelagophyceae sp. CCMP2097]